MAHYRGDSHLYEDGMGMGGEGLMGEIDRDWESQDQGNLIVNYLPHDIDDITLKVNSEIYKKSSLNI